MKGPNVTYFKTIKRESKALKITFRSTLRQGKFPSTFTGWLPESCFIIRCRLARTKQVQCTRQSPGHATPTSGGRVHFLAGNPNNRGNSLLGNAESRGFHNIFVAMLHGLSQSKLQRRGMSPRIKWFSPASAFSSTPEPVLWQQACISVQWARVGVGREPLPIQKRD
jgi:hypothetical protein